MDQQPPIDASALHERRERVFLVLAGLFLGTLAMLNILGISRFVKLGQWGEGPGAWVFAVAVGVLPYPVTFLCTDLFSETVRTNVKPIYLPRRPVMHISWSTYFPRQPAIQITLWLTYLPRRPGPDDVTM